MSVSGAFRVRVDRKEQEIESQEGVGVGREFPYTPSPENVFNFQVKNAVFYAFLLRKTTCGQKP